jgi:uncharacterized membrane protein YphA (DoxX/SURF4 family)
MMIRIILSVVLLAAGLGKLLARTSFVGVLRAFGLPSLWAAEIVAAVLPRVECVLGMALLLGWFPTATAYAVVGLLSIFIAGVSWKLVSNGGPVRCGCFGGAGAMGWNAVLRNVGLLVLATALIARDYAAWLTVIAVGCVATSIVMPAAGRVVSLMEE